MSQGKNTDFRISTAWRKSRKRRRLQRRLGAEGVLAVEDLWAYCAESRPSGDLGGLSNEDIADEVWWDGDPNELVSNLAEIGLLDGSEGAYIVHDWVEHNPWASGADERSRAARKSVHARWAKEKKCKGGTEFCSLEECGHPNPQDATQEVVEQKDQIRAQNTNPYDRNTHCTDRNTPYQLLSISNTNTKTNTRPDAPPDPPQTILPDPGKGVASCIESGSDLEKLASEVGWHAGNVPRHLLARAKRLTPISPPEVALALERTKLKPALRKPLAYFLGVVEGCREDERAELERAKSPPIARGLSPPRRGSWKDYELAALQKARAFDEAMAAKDPDTLALEMFQ